jgi:hypothetical protein
VSAGRTLEDVTAAGLTRPWDDTWGRGFIRPNAFVESVYRSLKGQ